MCNNLYYISPVEDEKGTETPDAKKTLRCKHPVPFSTPPVSWSDQVTPKVRLHPRSSPTDLQRLQMLPHEGVGGAGDGWGDWLIGG